jgi:hypothetical protein
MEFYVIQNAENGRWLVSQKGGCVHKVIGAYATLQEAKDNTPKDKPCRVFHNVWEVRK